MARATLLAVDDGVAVSDRAERTVRALFEHPLIDVTWSRYEGGERGPDPHVHHEHFNFHAPSTGFIAYLRGERENFDSFDPPIDGGRSAADATVTPVGGGERFERSNRTLAILGDEPQLSAIEIAFDSDFEVESHRHDDHVDSFFVLEGEVEFAVGDLAVRAGRGTWMSAPPGAEHGFRNAGASRARVLNIHAPETGFADGIRRF